VLCCTLLVLGGSASGAIVMRHDRSDAAYRKLGEVVAAVGTFGKTGSGTLIAPRAVLTAAHVARAVKESGTGFTVGGRTLPVAATVLHPAWQEGGPHDLAVVLLAEASTVTPIAPCATEPRPGQVLLLAGWGDAKVGRHGARAAPASDDDRPELRAARNAIARLDDHWLVFTFDAPRPARTSKASAPPATAAARRSSRLTDLRRRREHLGRRSRAGPGQLRLRRRLRARRARAGLDPRTDKATARRGRAD
jgi:hypothetical protein